MAAARDDNPFSEIETILLRQAEADPEELGGSLLLFSRLPAARQAALIAAIEQLPPGEAKPRPTVLDIINRKIAELAASIEDLTGRVNAVIAFTDFAQHGYKRPERLFDAMRPAMQGRRNPLISSLDEPVPWEPPRVDDPAPWEPPNVDDSVPWEPPAPTYTRRA